MAGELVLVTGGAGFVGVHCIVQLLQAGYRVRTTLRSLGRADEVRAMVRAGGAEPGEALAFTEADLTKDAGWPEAVAGCTYVLHVASPFPAAIPKDENELIIPAREGALRVLRAARDAGVKRVVLTSSFAAIGYGQPIDKPFTEENWTDTTKKITPYAKSKTLAERAAWDFIAAEGGALELAVVNPVAILGPVLGADLSTSIAFIERMLKGDMPGIPRLAFGFVDVRDVADLHVKAMTDPAAKGERFLAISGDALWAADIARALKARLGEAAAKVPTRELPNVMVRLAALFDPALATVAAELGKIKHTSSAKAQRLLNWRPRTPEDSAIATAESLIKLGLV